MKKILLMVMIFCVPLTQNSKAAMSDYFPTYQSTWGISKFLVGKANEITNAAYLSLGEFSSQALVQASTAYAWASDTLSQLSLKTKEKASQVLQEKAVDWMGLYIVDFVEKRSNKMIKELIYKQKDIHVEDFEGNTIGHVYNDNSRLIRNFAQKFGINLDNLIPFIPLGWFWNKVENSFVSTLLTGKTLGSELIRTTLGKKIKAQSLRAIGAAVGIAADKIEKLLVARQLSVSDAEEAALNNQISGLVQDAVSVVRIDEKLNVAGIEIPNSIADPIKKVIMNLRERFEIYGAFLKVEINDGVASIVKTIANVGAANIADRALNLAEDLTHMGIGVAASVVDPSFGLLALMALNGDKNMNMADTYVKQGLKWMVGYDDLLKSVGEKATTLEDKVLEGILPKTLYASKEDREIAEIFTNDIKGFVSSIQSEFNGLGEKSKSVLNFIKNIPGNIVGATKNIVSAGVEVSKDVDLVVKELMTDPLPESFGHNIYDAEPGDDEEILPDAGDAIANAVSKAWNAIKFW